MLTRSEQYKVYLDLLLESGLCNEVCECIAMTLTDFGERFLGELYGEPGEVFTNVYGTELIYHEAHPDYHECVEVRNEYNEDYFTFIGMADFVGVVEAVLAGRVPRKVDPILFRQGD